MAAGRTQRASAPHQRPGGRQGYRFRAWKEIGVGQMQEEASDAGGAMAPEGADRFAALDDGPFESVLFIRGRRRDACEPAGGAQGGIRKSKIAGCIVKIEHGVADT